jgi:hypothetical protein
MLRISRHVTTVSRVASVVETNPLLDWLLDDGGGDRAMRDLVGSVKLRVGAEKVVPSGLDLVACGAARSVLSNPAGTIAIAIPRGLSPLPVLIGVHLVIARVVMRRRGGDFCGSVAVSTQRTELRQLAAGITFEDSDLNREIRIARLVSEPRSDKRVRAAALGLDRRDRKGLDQQDSYLLFQLPNRAPPVALNVIGAMVCDTHRASEESWERTWERNVAARRRQVWLGELGDEVFEGFCRRHEIRLLRCDWPLIKAATDIAGRGRSRIATTPVCRRAVDAPPLAYRVVEHAELDEELREFAYRLSEMRKRGRDDAPDALANASWLASVLTRSAAPVAFYDAAVAHHPMSRTASWLLERVIDAGSSSFRNQWKGAFEQHWTGVKGAAKQALRLLSDSDEHPKWWAVQERLTTLADGETLRIVCQTGAEARAMREALLESELVHDTDFGGLVEVTSFSQRGPAGPVGHMVTLLCSPPPPQRAAIYLSGETGAVEVLCYPFEVGRLRAHLARAWRETAGLPFNLAVLDALKGSPSLSPRDTPLVELTPLLTPLPGYGERIDRYESPAQDIALPPANADFWEGATALYDTELAEGTDRESPPDAETSAYSGYAHLVRFLDGPSIYMRDDADCTVVVDDPENAGEHDIVTIAPAQLERGMRIAVLPGSERGGLLAELMAAWDEGLARVRRRYETLYRLALDAALERHGIDELARMVQLSPGAVRNWQQGKTWPGSQNALRIVLERSGNEEAVRNSAVIQNYFSRVRGAHRYIGRVLNDAVGETVLHGRDGGSVHKLEVLVGRDLTDLFDATSVLTVESVAPATTMPAAVCGSFLDRDDPYLKSKGAV